MRILQVSDYFPDYGARIVDTVSRKLAFWGHEVLVLAGTANQLGGYYSKGWVTLEPNLRLFRFGAFGVRGAGTFFSIPSPNLPALFSLVRKFNPDVANLHFAPHLGNVLLAPFLRMEGIPILFTLHGVSTGYSSLALRVSSTLINSLARLPIRLASQIIAVNDPVFRLAQSIYRVEHRKLRVIPNGIDVQTFRPISRFPREFTRVGYCGRLSAAKNIDTVIRAIHLARVKYGLPLTGMIAGDGPARENLESLAMDLSVPVEFTGHLSTDEVAHFYNEIDCLAHPSLVEGLPQSILEAMSCEVPVLACRTGGVGDLIQDKVNGLVLNSGAVDELATAILTLARDEKLRKRISMNGRMIVLKSYSDSVMCSRYLEVYENACHHN